jgi:hypothetical protein
VSLCKETPQEKLLKISNLLYQQHSKWTESVNSTSRKRDILMERGFFRHYLAIFLFMVSACGGGQDRKQRS